MSDVFLWFIHKNSRILRLPRWSGGLRPHVSKAGNVGLIPGQGTRTPQGTQCSQWEKNFKVEFKNPPAKYPTYCEMGFVNLTIAEFDLSVRKFRRQVPQLTWHFMGGYTWGWSAYTRAMDWILCPKSICWSPNPTYIRRWLYLETDIYRANWVKMRLLGQPQGNTSGAIIRREA